MGSDISKQPHWRRTRGGEVALRLIEEWQTGPTEHGDIAIAFPTSQGTDPDAPDEKRRGLAKVLTEP